MNMDYMFTAPTKIISIGLKKLNVLNGQVNPNANHISLKYVFIIQEMPIQYNSWTIH